MPERIQCEFYLLRYVPDAVKNEFVNIGVMLREAGRAETTRVRLTRDWGRVRCLDPDADTGLLEAMEGELAARVREVGAVSGEMGEREMGALEGASKPMMAVLEESLSTSVQMTEARGALAESFAAEMEQLMRLYVEPMREKMVRRKSGRASIAAAMRREFERAGVWGLMRKRIAASLYTRAGDPLKLDCGYRVGSGSTLGGGGAVRVFQAVSLEGDLEAAQVLSYAAGRLREGMRRVEGGALDLAAVVEPLRAVAAEDGDAGFAGEDAERYRFGVETMEEAQIRVLTVSDLARVAETAKRELLV